jgi:hypothetical protein
MEKVRAALAAARLQWITESKADAALAEVEEWEARLATAENWRERLTAAGRLSVARAEAAEAERDEARESLRKLSTSMSFGELTARAEAAEARLAEAKYQQKIHQTFGEEQFALREAAEAERDRLKEALRQIVVVNDTIPPSNQVLRQTVEAMRRTARAALAANEVKA